MYGTTSPAKKPSAEPATSLVFESTRLDDLDDIMRLVRTTGWPHRTEDVSVALALGHGLKAIHNGTVVGVAMWWTFGFAAGRVGVHSS